MTLLIWSLFLVISISQHVLPQKMTCKTENGKPVDWFINYKIPKLEERSDIAGSGYAYAYLLSNKRSSKFRLSPTNISSPTSMLGHTLQPFYANPKKYTYLMYNDDNPDSDSSSVGHTKGIVVFDQESGFWIIHSIPKFPEQNRYYYPPNAVENGQSILCITFHMHSLNEIGKELLYNGPSIYAKNLNLEGLDDDVQSLFSDSPSFVRKGPFHRVSNVKSKQGTGFTIFAKDNQFDGDLYSDLIAPTLKTSLFVETWRRGSGTPSDPSCDLNYKVLDITAINLSVIGGHKKNMNFEFPSTEDHSKWAIAEDSNKNWICIGDINRMESQKKRGGGSACFKNSLVWKAFYSSIYSTDDCKKKIKL